MRPWQLRFLILLGIKPNSSEAKDALSGVTKHGRQRRKPKAYQVHRKKRRKATVRSRRINR